MLETKKSLLPPFIEDSYGKSSLLSATGIQVFPFNSYLVIQSLTYPQCLRTEIYEINSAKGLLMQSRSACRAAQR